MYRLERSKTGGKGCWYPRLFFFKRGKFNFIVRRARISRVGGCAMGLLYDHFFVVFFFFFLKKLLLTSSSSPSFSSPLFCSFPFSILFFFFLCVCVSPLCHKSDLPFVCFTPSLKFFVFLSSPSPFFLYIFFFLLPPSFSLLHLSLGILTFRRGLVLSSSLSPLLVTIPSFQPLPPLPLTVVFRYHLLRARTQFLFYFFFYCFFLTFSLLFCSTFGKL